MTKARNDSRSALQQIETLLRANTPIIHIKTSEPARVIKSLQELAAQMANAKRNKQDRFVLRWTITRGVEFLPLVDENGVEYVSVNEDGIDVGGIGRSPESFGLPSDLAETVEPDWALRTPIAFKGALLMIVQGFADWIDVPAAKQLIFDAYEWINGANPEDKPQRKTIIFLGDDIKLPQSVSKLVTVVEWSLPTVEELELRVQKAVDFIAAQKAAGKDKLLDMSDQGVHRLAKAMGGMAATEAEQALRSLVAELGGLSDSDEVVRQLSAHRAQIIAKSGGVLEYIETDRGIDSIGGNEVLKSYMLQAADSFDPRAAEFGAEIPRGVLVIGPPGTGKTLASQVIASIFGKPLVKLSMAKAYGESGGIIGQSEKQLYTALSIVEAIGECVLMIDEVEKMFASSGGERDGGTSTRMLGEFLSWLEDKAKGKVFVVASANRGDIDAALLRRLGQRFLVDLPGFEARKEIIAIHFARRNRPDLDSLGIDLDELAALTVGYAGSELEDMVKLAVNKAWTDVKRGDASDVQQQHALSAIREVVPVSRTLPAQIVQMRRWAAGNALPASEEPSDWSPEPKKQKPARPASDASGEGGNDETLSFGKSFSKKVSK